MNRINFIIVMLLTSATAWADDSGYIGKNVIWCLTDEDGDNTKETLTISGSGDMDMAYFNEDVPWLSCKSNIKTVVIESGVTSIVYGAFSYCNNLTSVTIPASVTYIDDTAFRDCGNLTSITIPSSVKTIGEMAFWECTGLTSVYIPSSVTIIDDFAFGSCSNLRTVIVRRYEANDKPITTLGWGVFRDCHEDLKIYVPADGLDVYKADNDWSGDAGKIDAFTFCGDPSENGGKNVIWRLTDEDGDNTKETLTISGSGDMANFAEDEIPWLSCRSNIKTVVIESGVTSIGGGAFLDCTGMTSVTIPDGLANIGKGAFKGCTGLTSVTIPSSVTTIRTLAFNGCTGLTSVVIPAGIKDIGELSFSGCTGLTRVFILAPKLDSYEENVFSNNADGRKIYVPKDCAGTYQEGWKKEDFKNDIIEFDGFCGDTSENGGKNVIWRLTDEDGDNTKETLTIAGYGAMLDNITSVNFPWYGYKDIMKTVIIENGVTNIGQVAFYLYKKLTSVTIPSGVTSIGGQAFESCTGLTSVTIPDGVTSIGDRAFYSCEGLTSVIIPASVTSIGETAFCAYSALESITVDKNNTKYDSRDVCNAIIEKNDNGDILILGCKNTVIPSTVTSIGKFAFGGCIDLTSVTIPSSVTSIGNLAFYCCAGLTSIIIPSSVTSIGERAFYGCTGLTSFIIPSSVTSIGNFAFFGCTGLTDVYCLADPDNLTWGESSLDFIKDPDKTTKTVCHVAGSKLSTFESKWNKGEKTDVNVTFMGDGIEPNGETYLATTRSYGSGTIIGDVKTFLPVGYDLSTATVTLAEVKGAPKDLPVIYGSAKDGEKLPDVFFVKYVPDGSDEAKTIQSDYDNALKGMDKRFVITDGTKTLADVISGTGVDASEAVILVLTNGKFTTVNFSAADLDKKAQPGLLLFVLTKWEYMHIKPSKSSAATSGNATTRTIGIGDGEATGIREVTLRQAQGPSDDAWYLLDGRKLSGQPTKKGIYIYKGKKVKI